MINNHEVSERNLGPFVPMKIQNVNDCEVISIDKES